jgi:hypothetical protein
LFLDYDCDVASWYLIMDFFCRLGGNPICDKLDLNSSNPKISSKPEIGYLQQLDCRYKNIALNKLGWDHTHYNSISPKKMHFILIISNHKN